MNQSENRPLWNPRWILLTLTLPVVLLLLFWGKDLAIVGMEMTKKNWLAAIPILTMALLYGISGTAFSLIQTKRERQTGLISSLIFLIAAVLIMILTVCNYYRMVPNVEAFILPIHRWLCHVFTFLMPSAVYFLLIIASRVKGTKANLYAAISVVGVPLLVYISAVLISQFSQFFNRGVSNAVLFILPCILIVAGFLFTLSLSRCFLAVVPWIRNSVPHARWVLPLVFALILPVCGLLLNIWIPFPCDLQHPLPYILTVINALVLWAPLTGRRNSDLILIGFKGALYWFPLYFFLVFLPWLPWFIPGILAFGAGFLILTPTLLFLLQNDFYYQDYQKSVLPRRQIKIAFLIGALLMPILFFSNAFRDRAALEYAVRTYYNTPYQMSMEQQKTVFDPSALKYSLDRYYKAKNGLELPFLSEIYNLIAFQNLVISDSQFLRMYSDMFGTMQVENLFPFSNSGRLFAPSPLPGLSTRTANSLVTVDSIKTTPTVDGAKMELLLKTTSKFNQEYVSSITIPDGVFVSGLSLEIEGKMERGSIAERKTALWIYEKITSANRDPALLYYTGANHLHFLVFPVTQKLPRRVIVEFLYPAGITPEIKLDQTACKLPSRGTPVHVQGTPVKRTPELVLILDRSNRFNKPYNGEEIFKQLISSWPEAKTFRIASGLIAAGTLSKSYSMKEFPEAFQEFQKMYQPGTPGFAAENVIKGTILNYAETAGKETYPVFILWSGSELYRGWNLLGFEEFVPEYPYLTRINHKWEENSYRFGDLKAVRFQTKPHPLVSLPDGRLVRADMSLIPSDGDGKYASARRLKAESLKLLRDPSLEKQIWVPLVLDSIRTEILIPQTSWIVLETEAQRRMLEEKQMQKLKAAAALDIENTGEVIRADAPDDLLFLILVLLGILCAGIARNHPWIRRFFRSSRNG